MNKNKFEIIKPLKSKKYLIEELGIIQNPQEALDRFISFFHKYKIKAELKREEEDMLLYQYGINDWTGKDENYEFNFTRQFQIPNNDEFLQLSLTLFYKPETIGEIEDDNSWSTDFKNLEDWIKHIKSTVGFKKVDGIKPEKIEITLEMT
ncbi:hypothetical protein [Aureivirga sp. CE67]|uniref:hypothetical protein n=1 Tax=Aureivirga sp. CE67 TaxID=1788983 RepID=UPI0018C9DDC7|nr:hypothetical protein [Aureivirga sp. CE67]